jgi:hypothetical protein
MRAGRKNMSTDDRRCKGFNWTVRGADQKEGSASWDGAQLAVLMDIRDELQELNRRLACSDLLALPKLLRAIKSNTEKPRMGWARVTADMLWQTNLNGALAKRIEDLDFSMRTYNCLKSFGKYDDDEAPINTVADLVVLTESELLRRPNFGRKSLNEIKVALQPLGLYLGMEKAES